MRKWAWVQECVCVCKMRRRATGRVEPRGGRLEAGRLCHNAMHVPVLHPNQQKRGMADAQPRHIMHPAASMLRRSWSSCQLATTAPAPQAGRALTLLPPQLTGRWPPSTTQGVMPRSTDAKSRSMKACCSLPGSNACSAGQPCQGLESKGGSGRRALQSTVWDTSVCTPSIGLPCLACACSIRLHGTLPASASLSTIPPCCLLPARLALAA